jgi:hypothetical protein
VSIEDDLSPASGGVGGFSSGGTEAGGSSASGGSEPVGGSSSSGGEQSEGVGGSIDLTPRLCDSSDGTGCEADELCVDDGTDACFPDTMSGCEGTCGIKLRPSTCEGGVSDCNGSVTCPELAPQECPEGQVHSIVDECWGPCVPADCCVCEAHSDCFHAQLTCDHVAGRCAALQAPEPRCRQPFEPGKCDGQRAYFTFIDGSCLERTASTCGYEPTGNLFYTLEECLWRCEGLPAQGECPEGRVAERVCLQCGAGGGCSKYALVCAKTCQNSDECDASLSCFEGTCSVIGCI